MYDNKDSGYFATVRTELLNLIPQENRNGTILEIGAASGETLLYAKNIIMQKKFMVLNW